MRLNTRKTTQSNTIFKKTALASAVLLTLFSTASFAQDVYDGSQPLTDSSTVAGNLEHLVGAGDGVLIDGNGVDLLIDNSTANTPKFVVGGYAGLFGSGQDSATVDGNKITIEKGNIGGNVYGGLSSNMDTESGFCNEQELCGRVGNETFENVNNTVTTNMNQVNLGSGVGITGSIYSGSIFQELKLENIKTTGINVASDYFFSDIKVDVKSIGKNLSSNNNSIDVKGNSNKALNLISGSVSKKFNVGDIIAADIKNSLSDESNVGGQNNSPSEVLVATARLNINSSSNISSSENSIRIYGNDNSFNNLISGHANDSIIVGSMESGDLSLVTELGYSMPNEVGMKVVNNSVINSNNNSIEVVGDNNVLNDVFFR